MDARDEPPVAPLELAGARREVSAHRASFGFEGKQRAVDQRFVDRTQRLRNRARRDRSQHFHAASDELARRVFGRPVLAYTFGYGGLFRLRDQRVELLET